ncbi:MAG: GEVED domain-containing protein [Bacteroidales bacterium]
MKRLQHYFAILFIAILFSLNGFAQNQNFPSKLKEDQTQLIDTRIDRMSYWKRLAKEGLVPYSPSFPVAPAEFSGSIIEAKSIKGGKDDSPDVPVTTATNVTQSENSVFINPANNQAILNSNNSTSWSGSSVGQLYGANYYISADGGQSFGGSHLGAGGSNQGDPATAINLDGTRMYVGFIHNNSGQGISYSTNGGTSWTSVVCGTASGSWGLLDKNHMWIDNGPTSPHEGNVYSAWTPFGGTNDSQIEIVRSTNGGVSYSTQMSISNAVNAGSHNQGVNIQTGPNGEVYAIWSIYDSWPSDEKAIGFTKSTNGGVSFQPAVRIIDNTRGIRTSGVGKNMRVNSFPVMAVDISGGAYNGNIYIVWTNIGIPGVNTGTSADVYLIKSTDGGSTWSAPTKVNQDPTGLGKKHYFPWITCDPETGGLSVIWYDDRNVGSSQVEVWCANSFDGGDTWEDFKVSDIAFTPSPIPGLASSYMGDYLGIAARGGKVYPVWTDNRNGLYMSYTSPYETNNLPKPTDLIIALNDLTGATALQWQYDGPSPLYFNVYRDGTVIGTTTDLTYSDLLPDYGVYKYIVTAVHTEGESVGAAGTIQWGNPHIAVDPLVVNALLAPGENITKTFSIDNVGELDLEYNIVTTINSKKSAKDYCNASGGCDEYIAQVIFGDINNSSSCSQYGDYTNLSTTVNLGETYDLTVVNGNVYTADDLGVWIDWNQDGDFDDPGENVVCGIDNGGQGTFAITVPADALPGSTRMRIRLKWSGSDCGSPCGTTTYGEVEDYTINVVGWLMVSPIEGVITAGESDTINVHFDAADLAEGTYTADLKIYSNDPDLAMVEIPVTLIVGESILEVVATASFSEICEGESTQLDAIAQGGLAAYTYLWEPPTGLSDPAIQNPVATPAVTTTYTVTVSDGFTDVSDEITITVDPLPLAPAIPTGDIELCQNSMNNTYETSGTPTASSYNWYIEPIEAGTISGNGNIGIVTWNPDFYGTAMVIVHGVNECGEGFASENLEVTIHPKPTVTLQEFNNVHLNTIPFVLTGGEPAGGVYSGAGVDEGMYYPETAGMGTHTITYTYTDGNGCTNSAEATILVQEPSGINQNELAIRLDVLPNPNTGRFRINLNTLGNQEISLKILNNQGVTVYSETIRVDREYSGDFNLTGFAEGMYYISVYSGEGSMLKKMVIRK